MCQPHVLPRILTTLADWNDVVYTRIIVSADLVSVSYNVVVRITFTSADPADSSVSDKQAKRGNVFVDSLLVRNPAVFPVACVSVCFLLRTFRRAKCFLRLISNKCLTADLTDYRALFRFYRLSVVALKCQQGNG